MKSQTNISTQQDYIAAAQTTIASTQADISKKQLSLTEAIQRPWVSIVTATPSRDWMIVDSKAVFAINFTLKNDGQMPAMGVWIDGEMYCAAETLRP
jgi:hypothetical protein